VIAHQVKQSCKLLAFAFICSFDLYQTQSVEKAIITPHFNEDVQEHGKRWLQD